VNEKRMEHYNELAHIIDRTALIENLLNQIIERYCSPRKEVFSFFWQVVLDSSVMPLGAKVKVAMAVSQQIDFKLKADPIHKLVSFRNAFAHHAIDAHPTLIISQNPEQDELHHMLHVISSSGKTSEIRRDNALKEFDKHFEQSKQSLLDLLASVNSTLK